MRGEFVEVAGARLYCYAAGTRGAGEPVVLLHGFPTSGHLWADVAPLLPAGHRILVVDLLGFGRSDRPRSHAVGIRDHAERIVELFDLLRIETACVVGHDVGGGIAQWLAVKHPARVSRLGLIDSVAFDAWPNREVKLARAMLPLTRQLPPSWLLSILRSDLLRGYRDRDRAVRAIEQYIRPFATPEGRDGLMQHLLALDCRDTVAIAPELKAVTAPTAIVWGQHDPFLPVSLGRRLQAAIPGATLDVLPDARHFTPEEAPRQIADIVANLLTR